jgi:hypothetical protein
MNIGSKTKEDELGKFCEDCESYDCESSVHESYDRECETQEQKKKSNETKKNFYNLPEESYSLDHQVSAAKTKAELLNILIAEELQLEKARGTVGTLVAAQRIQRLLSAACSSLDVPLFELEQMATEFIKNEGNPIELSEEDKEVSTKVMSMAAAAKKAGLIGGWMTTVSYKMPESDSDPCPCAHWVPALLNDDTEVFARTDLKKSDKRMIRRTYDEKDELVDWDSVSLKKQEKFIRPLYDRNGRTMKKRYDGWEQDVRDRTQKYLDQGMEGIHRITSNVFKDLRSIYTDSCPFRIDINVLVREVIAQSIQ